ncbi:MAG: ABC transporter permease, partial [Candidatus Berkiellales bacterium]
PIAFHTEKTYSAPFAIYAFTKEATVLPNGSVVREYPRLTYAGITIKDQAEHRADILHRLFVIMLKSILLSAALSVLLMLIGCARHHLSWEAFFAKVLKGQTDYPWRSFLLFIWLMISLMVFIHDFMPVYHIFGTNQVGEDVLYQTLKSIRTGLIIGTLTTLVMLPFAVLFGMMAGYFRGWIDDVIQYIYTTLSSIPGVLLIAAAVLAIQMVMDRHTDWFQSTIQRADARLLALCAILGITSWTTLCRLMRAESLKISQMDYVQAAHSLGVSDFKVLLRHLLPNVLHIILITVALDFSGLVLAEAVLSYVGVGVDPSSISWGTMINSARLEMARIPVVWWNLAAAFIFMFILVLAANIFSDAVRDSFDPHYQGAM